MCYPMQKCATLRENVLSKTRQRVNQHVFERICFELKTQIRVVQLEKRVIQRKKLLSNAKKGYTTR